MTVHRSAGNHEHCVAIYTPRFGAASEVWLWRQVVGMRQGKTCVITRQYLAKDEYAVNGTAVHVIPMFPPRSTRARRLLDRVANVRLGGYRGPPEEARWLLECLRKDKPAVILAHFASSAFSILPIARSLGIPVVAHGNGIDMSARLNAKWYRRRLASSLKYLAGFVVVADYMAEWLMAHGMDAKRIHMIPYGVPIDMFEPAQGLETQPCRFVAIGRFTEKKRPDLVVRAFARCAERCPKVELRMIGEGEMREECEQLARELNVSGQVTFLGGQPNTVVKDELKQAGAFLQHSVTASSGDMEGWPVAVAEAAATGLPVVATRHAGIPKQVDSGETGFLVAENDWQAMADCMTQLASDPELRVRMGKAGRRKMTECDTANQVEQLEEVLLAAARGVGT